jgi:hypothetical protein
MIVNAYFFFLSLFIMPMGVWTYTKFITIFFPIVDGIYKSKKLNISFQFLFVSLTAVVIFERRWQFHGFGLLDAIEVCVSEPGSIDVSVWKEQSRTKREYKLLWRYTING